MSISKTERALEEIIEESLIRDSGYIIGDSRQYNKELALIPEDVLKFIRNSQPKDWARLNKNFPNGPEREIIERLKTTLNRDGMLKTLKRGLQVYDVKLRVAFFKPASGLNPEAVSQYNENELKVIRQLYYSEKNKNSLDMVLFLNGLPIVTMELKNQFTRQTAEDAIRQYKNNRDPKELLFQFKKRALVHFAVDTDEVYMTTKLNGDKTFFLPFNKGRDNGAGNPLDEVNGFRTAYLWKEVWQRDSQLDIINRFLHIDSDNKMIFPRYHQLDAVRKLEKDVLKDGVGKSYLIQHSAGSGKSNSIAWLAHRLSNFYNLDDRPVFDSIIVLTDRVVLDKQLQDTIYQFDHKQGVVEKIDENSKQLAEALRSNAKIIVSTLFKFSYIIEEIEAQTGKNFAIIVDEAHSSQSGESASAVKEVLSAKSLDEATELEERIQEAEDDVEEEIIKTLSKRGRQSNLSFFAFTATPKNKTLEMFGQKGSDGKPEPFHLYSMKQAIEEGFILDVLQNYMTYKTYYRLAKKIEKDPNVDKKKAQKAIARFVSLHPHNLAQKTEIMVEHFRQTTMHKIGGKAKAMVVTSSRLHAYRYQREFERYIREKRYTDVRTLVAFSGSIHDDEDGNDYTESKVNGFSDKELPEKFNDDYQVLIVANKYQTGFDQPLLHTMFVDKKLDGIQAVQTLSRLNRTHSGKKDTFVLDFVNETSDVQHAFLPYFEKTELDKETDFHLLFDLKSKLDDFQIYWDSDIEAFCKYFFDPDSTNEELGKLHLYIDPAVERYKKRSTEEKDEFKTTLIKYVRLYSFISQIMPFQSVQLHKLATYSQLLVTKLPKGPIGNAFKLGNEVDLSYYRIEETSNGNISLIGEGKAKLKGITAAGTGSRAEDQKAKLSTIIDTLNERFGTEFTPSDKLFFDQIEEDMKQDEDLIVSAKNNTLENFKYVFDDVFITKVIGRMGQNQDIFTKIMDDTDFQSVAKAWMMKSLYESLQDQ